MRKISLLLLRETFLQCVDWTQWYNEAKVLKYYLVKRTLNDYFYKITTAPGLHTTLRTNKSACLPRLSQTHLSCQIQVCGPPTCFFSDAHISSQTPLPSCTIFLFLTHIHCYPYTYAPSPLLLDISRAAFCHLDLSSVFSPQQSSPWIPKLPTP